MNDTAPQTADGKVLMHFTMSLDGFVAGPNHEMDWTMCGFSSRPGLLDEYVETTGAILGGRDGWDAFPDPSIAYGGAWNGPLFVLTHHPEDATPAVGRRLFQLGLIDEIDLHIAPILLGDGIRLYDNADSEPIPLERASEGTMSEVNVRYRPAHRARTR